MAHFAVGGGIRLYYEETGTGFPIVFVHEFAGDYRSYDLQVRHFSRRYRCIAYNARGYPPSDVPSQQEAYSQQHACDDLFALLDHLHIDAAHLVGVSMGAFTALFVALDAPQRVRSAVIAGCGFGADPLKRYKFAHDIDDAAQTIEDHGMAAFAQTYGQGPARIQFKNKDCKGWQEMVDLLAAHSAEGSAMTLRGVQKARPSLYELRERLTQLHVPVLIVTGDEDEPCLDASLYLKRTLPAAGLAILPRTGHTVNLEEPVRFNRLCEELFILADTDVDFARDPLSRRENAFGRG